MDPFLPTELNNFFFGCFLTIVFVVWTRVCVWACKVIELLRADNRTLRLAVMVMVLHVRPGKSGARRSESIPACPLNNRCTIFTKRSILGRVFNPCGSLRRTYGSTILAIANRQRLTTEQRRNDKPRKKNADHRSLLVER